MLRFVNNWSAELLQPLASNGLQLEVAPELAARLEFGAGDHYLLTLLDTTPGSTAYEVVRVTAASGGVLTLAERGVEDRPAQDWLAGARVICSCTAATLQALAAAGGGGGGGGYGQQILDVTFDGTYTLTDDHGLVEMRLNQMENPASLVIPNAPRQVDVFIRSSTGSPPFTISTPGNTPTVEGSTGSWYTSSGTDLIIENLNGIVWGRLYVNPNAGTCHLLVLHERSFDT